MKTSRHPPSPAGSRAARGLPWLLCVAVLGTASTLAPAATPAATGAVDQRIAADPAGTVAVSNVAGRVEIEGWNRPEVHVGGQVGRNVQRVEVIRDGARTVVKVVLPRGASMRGSEAMLQIRMPAASRLEVSTVSADVQTRGIAGAQRVSSVSGDLALDAADAPLEVKTVSGDVLLRGSGRAGKARVSSVSGDLRTERLGGELEATTVSGDQRLVLGALRSLRLRSTSGDVELRGAPQRGATLEVESVSGDLTLALQAAAGFELDAESFSGEISTCYGARGASAGAVGPGKVLRSRRGEGGARLRLKTMSGEISVCDR
ncbi:MAG: DUF4097 family beta strand repeat protein [Gammaproteobacteria bacterium]|nr:DUF4097 family beta strand repeat protein [Gammaproteobacteria bacterium]